MIRIERSSVPYGQWSRMPDIVLLRDSRPPTPGELVETLEIKFAEGSSYEDAYDAAAE